MGNTIAQPILRVVPPLTNQGESPPPPVPALSGAVLLPPPPPPLPPENSASPAAEPPYEYPTAPDVVAIVREFAGPSGDDMTMMTAYGVPVFLPQAVEALARDARRSQQHTVAAMLDRGLPFLREIPGLLECLDARQMLLRVSCNQFTRQFLDHIVALDLPTAGLGDTRFCVRVDREQRGGIGVVAAAAGLP